ncbi:hypothetical protein F8O01_17295 [Pseudoclavibacter chungangensis]|uniref:Uncharacterized protein n=2 Tax=Pseudoclavibacter chungangensis TaxID=587635 RepID=A0A7J5BM25_9MICO|nr:hypothetical protein [Pseudoclavibacter chungangensis]KAB1652106.1 hypothetical protein F8O01_17295 [Pseudoclavibacter chungangensis]NYJ65965.1 hypothetical protein [Pseudoclavibacter chungangensis]
MIEPTDLLAELLDESPEEIQTPLAQPTPVNVAAKTMPTKRRQPEISPGNLELMAFLAKFPGATLEAMSMLQVRQANPFHKAGTLRAIGGVEATLKKLRRMGILTWHRDPAAQENYYSITSEGLEILGSTGYDTAPIATLQGVAKTRAAHFSAIAQVAAQLYSPAGFFKNLLGIAPLSLDALVSEKEMRSAFEPVKSALREAKKKGQPSEFGPLRTATMEARFEQVAQGQMALGDVLEAEPMLWTLGFKPYENSILKPIHQPDLAARIPSNGDEIRSANLLIEVELSKKSWQEYESILATLAAELREGLTYGRAIYFTIGTQIPTLLKKVDAAGNHGLISSGKLLILPLKHRDGTPYAENRRINLA